MTLVRDADGGLDLPALGGVSIEAVRLVYGNRTARSALPRAGLGLSRRRLDEALQSLDRAGQLAGNVPICWSSRAAVHLVRRDYAAALRDIVTITKQINAPLEQAAVSHRDAGTVPEDAAANEHSGLSAFEGGLLATGIAALTSAAGFGWSALDWSEILSQLGQFFS